MININPIQFMMAQMGQQAQNNPQMAKVMQMIQNNPGTSIQDLAKNLYQSSGKDYSQFTQQMQSHPQINAAFNMLKNNGFNNP